MSQTLVATFDNLTQANLAVERLVSAGFERSSIDVKTSGSAGSTTSSTDSSTLSSTNSSTHAASAREDEGVLESIGRFFSDLFGADEQRDYASHYSEAVRRGKAVLTLQLDNDDRMDDASTCLLEAGALDIDDHVESWRSEGYTAASGQAPLMNAGSASVNTSSGSVDSSLTGASLRSDRETASTSGSTYRATPDVAAVSGTTATGASSSSTTRTGTDALASDREEVIPVVQEELEVGKRRVEQGRVRVVSRVSSQPVQESVELQSEKAVIERRPVDRPASEADLSNLQDRTVEVRESAEKAVVNKTARVVEEVVVGKQVQTETKQIDDSVRRTEVSVERDSGTGDNSATTASSFDTHRDRFRSDYEANYANSGTSFDAYEPAYRSGYELRSDERYRGKSWDEVEPSAREQWEASNPGTWERMRDAHRRGWDWERS